MGNRGDDGLTPYERAHPRGRWHAEKDCPMTERPAPYDTAEPAPATPGRRLTPDDYAPYAVVHLGDVTIPKALWDRLWDAGFGFLTHSGALEHGQVAYLIALGLAAHERGERAS
ncbi:MAG TPA: hypothetical protein VFL91_10320 [Thermomicrobiales bacterium]|nr:hypothetical protein [Thermomicrobiales bacterium]